VRHFHFTAWPDHGVPQGTEVLIRFRGLVRQHIERDAAEAPTVVHCRYRRRAGLERKGGDVVGSTYITSIISYDIIGLYLD